MAGALFGDFEYECFWPLHKMSWFSTQNTRLQCEINLVGERAGFGLTGPNSDHGQVMLRSAVHHAWSPVSHSHCVLHLNVWLLFFFLPFLLCCVFDTSGQQIPSSTMFPLPWKLPHRLVQFYWYLWLYYLCPGNFMPFHKSARCPTAVPAMDILVSWTCKQLSIARCCMWQRHIHLSYWH